ncbi:uncharacterized protein LOC107303819 [Oryza brachyantha]|uniref:uncharacterized protein LOC107303819 n=1 Tax=Oryza brachyantha TaxID=4533 RepID=UPI001ADAA701|nr:uncharacterized protein LOC107303819 [Oryza brachyantha]
MDGFGSRLVFSPDDEQLTDSYLQSYLVRSSLSDLPPVVSSFFHVADVYSAPPDELLAGLDPAPGTGDGDGRVWYLFSPVRVLGSRGARKARTVVGAGGGNECWHAEGGPRDIEKSGAGGKLQKFSYKIKTASGVVKPGWLMVEYSLPGSDRLALCKVYRSPRKSRYSPPTPSSSPATVAPPPSVSGCKRKAEEGDHPEAPSCSAPRRTPPAPVEGDHGEDDLLLAGSHQDGQGAMDVGLPPEQQNQDIAASAAATQVLALGDQEHEGDGEFDERADPESWEWENYLSAVLNETCKQETLATAAAGQPPEETAVL